MKTLKRSLIVMFSLMIAGCGDDSNSTTDDPNTGNTRLEWPMELTPGTIDYPNNTSMKFGRFDNSSGNSLKFTSFFTSPDPDMLGYSDGTRALVFDVISISGKIIKVKADGTYATIGVIKDEEFIFCTNWKIIGDTLTFFGEPIRLYV